MNFSIIAGVFCISAGLIFAIILLSAAICENEPAYIIAIIMLVLPFTCFGICLIRDGINQSEITYEESLTERITEEYDELLEKVEASPFDKNIILDVIDMNYNIDVDTVNGEGNYFGLERIDLDEIQTNYIVKHYSDKLVKK